VVAFIDSVHLGVSFIPHLKRDELDDFWEYNKSLFLKFAESSFFSAVIYIGLAIAIAALQNLFGLFKNNGEIYGYTFVTIAGLFHPIYFLSIFPEEFDDLAQIKPIKTYTVFSEWIMIPITLLYMFILYAFATKIMFTWTLPEGWIAKMVLGFCVVGILTFLLNFRLPQFSDNRLTYWFQKLFFPILTVPVILIFISIYRRLDDYGLTENRYLILALGIWMLLNVGWFLFNKKQDIRFIPISLFGFILFALFMPALNMFDVSVNDQKKRLVDKFVELDMLKEGKMIDTLTLDHFNKNSIENSLTYLYDRKNLSFLNRFSSKNIDLSFTQNMTYTDRFKEVNELKRILGLMKIRKPIKKAKSFNDPIALDFNKRAFKISGKGILVPMTITIYDDTCLKFHSRTNSFEYYLNNKLVDEFKLVDQINQFAENQNNINQENSLIQLSTEKYKYSLLINRISFYLTEKGRTLNSIYGQAFVEEIK